jgi:hypothetical protein
LDIDRVLASYDLQAWAEEGALEARSDEEQPPEEA